MSRLSVLATGSALAITMVVLNSLCAAAVVLWPAQSIGLVNAWMHGVDLQLIRATAPLTLARFLYGLLGIAAIGFLTGVVYAWTYNHVHDAFRAQAR